MSNSSQMDPEGTQIIENGPKEDTIHNGEDNIVDARLDSQTRQGITNDMCLLEIEPMNLPMPKRLKINSTRNDAIVHQSNSMSDMERNLTADENEVTSRTLDSENETKNVDSETSLPEKLESYYNAHDVQREKIIKASVRLKSLIEIALRRASERLGTKCDENVKQNERSQTKDSDKDTDAQDYKTTREEHAMELSREHVAECMILQRVRNDTTPRK